MVRETNPRQAQQPRPEPGPLLCSISDASLSLGVSRSKTYELIADGVLSTVSIGRRRLVRTDSIRAIAFGEAA
jgi:excisionase family DNA binding protein